MVSNEKGAAPLLRATSWAEQPTLSKEEIERMAWAQVLNGAESSCEDAINEDYNLSEADFERICDRAAKIIEFLRAATGAKANG